MNPFLNLSDYTVCLIVAKQIAQNEKVMRTATNHEKENTDLWNDVLRHTYVGLLVIEVYDRDISEEYFRRTLRVAGIE